MIYGSGGTIRGSVARVLARDGAKVFIAGRTQAKLDVVARDIAAAGGDVETAQIDALDERAVEDHANAVAEAEGGIDVGMNAVGFPHDQGTPLENLSLEAHMRQVDSFLRWIFITSKAVSSHMAIVDAVDAGSYTEELFRPKAEAAGLSVPE